MLFCWAGPGEDGMPLRCECSRRGLDTGFDHLSCLVGNAASESMKWDASDMNEFVSWRVYSICFKSYQNQFAVNISTEFVLFVQGQYLDNQLKQVEALNVKLDSLPMVRIHSALNSEASNVVHKILSLIGQVKGDSPRLPARYLCMKAPAHNNLGCIVAEGASSTESAKEAVVHF